MDNRTTSFSLYCTFCREFDLACMKCNSDANPVNRNCRLFHNGAPAFNAFPEKNYTELNPDERRIFLAALAQHAMLKDA